jgi:hypothetical protein
MQRRQRIVFANMGGIPREEPQEISIEEQNYRFNTMVFEIAANWEFVLALMAKISIGNLKSVDPLERDWLNFILENQVDFHKCGNSDQFIENWFKKINE